LNIHWFFDKLDMTGSKAQLYNGFMLLFSFFSCRLVWGTYQSVRVYQDVWAALHHKPLEKGLVTEDGIMRFAGEEYVPLWLAFTYLGSNVVLNTLNFYWFGKMIETLRKRFQAPAASKKKEKAIATRTTGANGTVKTEADETEVRRRRAAEEPEELEAIS
jgi:hypothetical protein